MEMSIKKDKDDKMINVKMELKLNGNTTNYVELLDSIEKSEIFIECCKYISENKIHCKNDQYFSEDKNKKLDPEMLEKITNYLISQSYQVDKNLPLDIHSGDYDELFICEFNFLMKRNYSSQVNTQTYKIGDVRESPIEFKEITYYEIRDNSLEDPIVKIWGKKTHS